MEYFAKNWEEVKEMEYAYHLANKHATTFMIDSCVS